MLEELRRAEHYIFMEYFIVEEGRMWSEILAVLEEKVRQGVDVRLLYDDMGPIMLLPPGFRRHVESLGIRCCVFNPFIPVSFTHLDVYKRQRRTRAGGAVSGRRIRLRRGRDAQRPGGLFTDPVLPEKRLSTPGP